jgi:hypothetical protein
MRTKDALKILHNLPKSEKNDFNKFMQSPFFQAQDNIYDLYRVILKNLDKLVFEDNDKIRQILSKKLKISDTALRKKLSHFCSMVMKYKKTKYFLDDELSSDVLIGRQFLDNGMNGAFEGQMNRIEEKLGSQKEFREDTLYMNYLYNVSGFNYTSRSSIGSNKWVSSMLGKHLDSAYSNFYLYTVIQLSGLYLNSKLLNLSSPELQNLSSPDGNSNELPLNMDTFFGNGFDSYFAGNEVHSSVYTACKLMYNAFEDFSSIEKFTDYKYFIETRNNILGFEVSRFHFGVLMNYCFLKEKLNENTEYFKNEGTVLLYNYIKENYYSTGGDDYLSPVVYRNFVLTAYSEGNFELLHDFILTNSSKLSPEAYTDMVYFANAYYYFGMKEFGKTLRYVNDLKFSSFAYRFDVRNIELRVLYEKGYYDILLNMLRSYTKTISTDKMLLKQEKDRLNLFIKYFNKLVLIKLTADRKQQVRDAQMLYYQISKVNSMALRNWLMEKTQDVYITEKGLSVKAG